ncbi:MAG: DUF3362 domain-containing protein [Polyangiaceae bacterium]
MMKALIFYWARQHWPLAREASKKAGRADLIGRAPHCLVPPDYGSTAQKGPGMPYAPGRAQGDARGSHGPHHGRPSAGAGRPGRDRRGRNPLDR